MTPKSWYDPTSLFQALVIFIELKTRYVSDQPFCPSPPLFHHMVPSLAISVYFFVGGKDLFSSSTFSSWTRCSKMNASCSIILSSIRLYAISYLR